MIKILYIILVLMLINAEMLFSSNAIKGVVVNLENNEAVAGITVKIVSRNIVVTSDQNGRFSIGEVPSGVYKVEFSGVGWRNKSLSVDVPGVDVLRVEMISEDIRASEIYVYGASKRLQKITESPSAISSYFKSDIEKKSRSGKLAEVFNASPGIDILQNGANDFIVNTRGFNGGLHRRVLVLQDGRDASMPLLGAQEWNSFAMPMDDFSRVEFVRGPAASLYGANAFNGVINLTSYSPKEVLGTKVSLIAGDYETFRGDVRNAGLITDNLSYRINLGYSKSLNYSRRRDSVQFLEYPGIVTERKQLTEDERQTFSGYGSIRFDYDFDESRRLVFESGYSRSGNETFVFGLGRTLVKDTERPYFRLAYNSENINVHTHYMQRSVADTMWLMVPGAYLLDNSKDIMIDFQHNFQLNEDFKFVWGVSEQIQMIRTYGTSIPDDVNADYTGIYGQVEWSASPFLKLVTSARFDYASIHSSQFSPRAAVLFSLSPEHKLRFSAGRAFQRPNYSELYRLTPDAPAFNSLTGSPVNFKAVQQRIIDSIAVLSGKVYDLDLNLDPFRSKAVGNEQLRVEKIIGMEAGYKGVFGRNWYVNADIYYNRLNDFITNFLPGINPAINSWSPGLEGELAEYNQLVYSMVMESLNPRDKQRLSVLNGEPVFVVSNANVGEVDEYGLEIETGYYLSDEIKISANYSYFGYNIVEANLTQPLLPNTSPHRLNATASYSKQGIFDCSLTVQYSAGFDWLAGTFTGYVPEYTIFHLNAGAYIIDSLRLGVNVFNLFDRKFYQIFGGTYLPRFATMKLSYEF